MRSALQRPQHCERLPRLRLRVLHRAVTGHDSDATSTADTVGRVCERKEVLVACAKDLTQGSRRRRGGEERYENKI